MPSTTQHSVRRQSGKAGPKSGVIIPFQLAAALAEGGKRLQIKQIEATHAAISENSLYCKSVIENMANSSSPLALWFALCQHKAQRYNEFAYACIDIMSQSAAAISRLLTESLLGMGFSLGSNVSQGMEPAVERRVAAKVISFPERRIATASVLMQAHAGNSGRQRMAQ